ncbi:MAG: hypothetical protein KF718_28595 [Polyangiaceae bacterium]|nr:hypothetical protein [Polyangiaceae bacterium]
MSGRLLALFLAVFAGCGNEDGRPPGRPYGGGGAKGCVDGSGGTSAAGGSQAGGSAGSSGAAGSSGTSDAGLAGAGGSSGADGGTTTGGSAGATGSGGSTASSGGCAGTGSGGAPAAAPTFPIQSCVITQHCQSGATCDAFNKNATSADCPSGSLAPGACELGTAVGACVSQVGNRCSMTFGYPPIHTESGARTVCENGGGFFVSTAGCDVAHRCDAVLQLGQCAEFSAKYGAAAVKSACGAGAYTAKAECSRKNAVGGCLLVDGSHCATVWYYKSDFGLTAARKACSQSGGHFLEP